MSQYSGLCPYLTIAGRSLEARDFFTKAFDAKEVVAYPTEDGSGLMHCQMEINGAALMFGEVMPGAPTPVRGGTITLHLEVQDADSWWSRAVAAGATILIAMEDQFWGARWGQLADPFGHIWGINGPPKG